MAFGIDPNSLFTLTGAMQKIADLALIIRISPQAFLIYE